jgi:zinc and cadmium transporter
VHNFVDGVLIAGAFLTDFRLGVLTTIAIAAHEVPQEIGDFIVLLNAGYSRRRAFAYNVLSGCAAVVGGVVGYFALQASREAVPYAIMIAAASFIYIALADLVPDMQRESGPSKSIVQLGLLATGIAIMAILSSITHSH